MQSPALAVASAFFLALASCSLNNYSFAGRDGLPPNVEVLEQGRQELAAVPGKTENGLGDVSWFPLIALNAEIYNVSDPQMPKGTGYAGLDAYGPLFMFVDVETYQYDEQQRLYERTEGSSYLWGLMRSERTDVRVPSGWRVDREKSILFGLLRWPAEYYTTNLPIDRLTAVVPPASSDSKLEPVDTDR
jgi:hypothetical protein